MHALASLTYLLHPLGYCTGTKIQVRDCLGYNSWSGILSDIGEVALVGAVATVILGLWHHHNCHVAGCWRLTWHANPETGHPECKVHHPDPHGYLKGTRHRRGRRLRIHLAHQAAKAKA